MYNPTVLGNWCWHWVMQVFRSCVGWFHSLFVATGLWTYFLITFFFIQLFVFFLLRIRPQAGSRSVPRISKRGNAQIGQDQLRLPGK